MNASILQIPLSLCLALGSHPSERMLLHRLPDNPYALDAGTACGPMCLAFLDGYLTGRLRYNETMKLCPAGPLGTNLQQVRTAAEELGYYTASFQEATVSQLRRLPFPAILHCQDASESGHFVVLLGWNPQADTFHVFSPPSHFGEVSSPCVGREFTGTGLVVSIAPLPPVENLLEPRPKRSMALVLGVLGGAAILLLLFLWARARRAKGSIASSKILALGCVLLWMPLITSCSISSVEPSGPAAPSVSLNSHEADYGKILQGAPLKHAFRVVNSSNRPFAIERVDRSCACQAVVVDQAKEIAPGECATVTVEVPTQGLEGPIARRFVAVTTSEDPAFSSIALVLRADVQANIKAIPSQIMFGNVKPGERSIRQLRVRANLPGLVEKFRSAEADNPFLSVGLCERAMGLLLFDVELDRGLPSGDISGRITLRFDHPEYSKLEVRVIGRKHGDLRVIPSRLTVAKDGLESPQRFKVRVASRDRQGVRVQSVDCPEGIAVQWEDTQNPTSSVDLHVEVRDEVLDASRLFLIIHTNRGDEATVKIPVLRFGASG